MGTTDTISVFAGAHALRTIREKGLRADDIKVVAGAAGGPKWLVLAALDRLLFSSWFADRKTPLLLVGASIGAWRFAALSRNEPLRALDAFQDAYIRQHYEHRPTPAEVTAESRRIMDAFMDERGIAEVLSHPVKRPSIMTVRCHWGTGDERKLPLLLGLGAAAFCNALDRRFLSPFFTRTVFHHPKQLPPFAAGDGFAPELAPLNALNFRDALLASGSIPLVMEGVPDIAGAQPGMYRDGGIVDYHLDIPFSTAENGLVLYPHYMPRIVPGWFDKQLKWRKPKRGHMRNVVMVSPSSAFIEKLPLSKIPDRNDFWLFENRDRERIAYWQRVVAESQRIADTFHDAVESGRIREIIRPMPGSE